MLRHQNMDADFQGALTQLETTNCSRYRSSSCQWWPTAALGIAHRWLIQSLFPSHLHLWPLPLTLMSVKDNFSWASFFLCEIMLDQVFSHALSQFSHLKSSIRRAGQSSLLLSMFVLLVVLQLGSRGVRSWTSAHSSSSSTGFVQ